MKKFISALLVLVLTVLLCACGESVDTETSDSTDSTTSSTTEAMEEYATLKTTPQTSLMITTDTMVQTKKEYDYVLNINSKKFHYPSCRAAESISDKNRKEYHGTRDSVISQGYDACGICNP